MKHARVLHANSKPVNQTLYYISSSITNLTRDILHLEPHLPRFCIRTPNTLHEHGNIEYTSNQCTFTGEQRMNTLPQVPRSQPSRAYIRIGSSLVLLRLAALTSTDAGSGSVRCMPRIPASKAGFGADGDVAGQRKALHCGTFGTMQTVGQYFSEQWIVGGVI